METYIYIIAAALLGGIAKDFYDSRKSRKPSTPTPDPQAETLRILLEKMDSLSTPDQPETPASILQRVEELEMRFERLHKDCLRWLQQGSQTWKRIQDRQESDVDDQEELDQQAAELMREPPIQADNSSDLEWAKNQLISRGETPII